MKDVLDSFVESLDSSWTAFEQVWQHNYGIEEVGGLNFIPDHIGMICRLNAAGRRYMLEDPSSREKGVGVLSSVADNLDCLYFHLRENPSLCDQGGVCVGVSPPAMSRKRRRR